MTGIIPLAIDHLTFRYRDRESPSLVDVSFETRAGEILLVAGASGSGKTTLIRCINGLIPRSYKGALTGKIRIQEEDTEKWQLSRISQQVGTVLQDPDRQILGSKVLNEVAFGLENLSLPRQEILDRVDESLEKLKISHLRDKETFNLSGGEKQKVALAGVLAMRPRILLLDEPLASLDPASAQETLEQVRYLADLGMTVLLVEHRVEDVLRFRPDRVLFIEGGRIKYLGEMDGLISSVNYHEIKLPVSMVKDRAGKEPRPSPIKILPGIKKGDPRSELVRFENVTFGYSSEEEVLHEVNLEIHRGDVIAVLGPNGAGKTTVVKHAIGLLKPRSGRVIVDGKDTKHSSIAEIASTLGYVFQSPSHMLFAPTVREELSFGPINLKHPKAQIEEEVQDSLKIVNLSENINDPPLSLSFGQQKRVSIAAILAMRSKILVMDEPTAGQDYSNYMKFMDSILQLPGFEAILFITHDVDLAVIYANRVLLVADGKLIADGKPRDVLSDIARLRACRLVPTSLLQTNLEHGDPNGAFYRVEELAHLI